MISCLYRDVQGHHLKLTKSNLKYKSKILKVFSHVMSKLMKKKLLF